MAVGEEATGALPSQGRNLALRLASAVVLLPIIIWLIALGGYAFALLVGCSAAICTRELLSMSLGPAGERRPGPLPPVAWLGVGLGFALCLSAVPEGLFARFAPLAAVGYLIASCAVALFAKEEPAEVVRDLPRLLFGWIYGAFPLALVVALRGLSNGAWWVILLCSITWLNDTGAYFVGRALGRHKLHPKVSPGKTWEGFFGGMLFSVGAAFAVRAVGLHALAPADCLALGIPAGVLGPLGDLSESLLKRAYGVKDSGRILPGHGGLLDRLDALLFNAPFVFLYAVVIKGLPWR